MGGVQERRLAVPAVLEKLAVACDFVAEVAREVGLDENAVYHCHLSVEEVCTNIIEHGYNFNGENEVISVVCQQYPDHLTITIIDDAPAFDPLSLAEPDPATPLWEREGGGWGVYFVKQYMDEVAYHYIENQNHFIMSKYR